MHPGPLFKIKHFSGRVLGPLDLERIRKLILKNQILGTEIAKVHPGDDWKDINSFPEIADLLLQNIQGKLREDRSTQSGHQSSYRPILNDATVVLKDPEATVVLSEHEFPIPPKPESRTEFLESDELTRVDPALAAAVKVEYADEDEDPTQVGPLSDPSWELEEAPSRSAPPRSRPGGPTPVALTTPSPPKKVHFAGRDWKRLSKGELFRVVIISSLLGYFGYDTFLAEEDSPIQGFLEKQQTVFRPILPDSQSKDPDPVASRRLYEEAMKYYVLDHTQGYLGAARLLIESVNKDDDNVKAISMLASCYINLIDSSNKDDTYFGVIMKLLEMANAKAIDLPETLIAETEFMVMTRRPAAAVQNLIRYTKKNRNFDPVIHYYAAHALYAQGDYSAAATQLSQISDNKAFSAKVFYLRGRTNEALKDMAGAQQEYQKALKVNPLHMQSLLRIVSIRAEEGNLSQMAPVLEDLLKKASLLSPQHQAETLFYQAKLYQLAENWEAAIFALSRAVKLDPRNSKYLLEYYSLKASLGGKNSQDQKEAKMYYFLGEGEKRVTAGDYQSALTQFIQAKDAHLDSSIPYMKIGEMFLKLNDMINARANFQQAAKIEPNSIPIWSKYIHTLIQSFEWEEAQKAMEKFRSAAKGQSAIDKLAGDFYSKQGRHGEAQAFYKKAMLRDTIDPDVYIAYAKSLMALKQYKDAPFFFALALRFDPLSSEATVGIARAMAETEGLNAGVQILQDELQKSGSARAELLGGIAELLVQKGEWKGAQTYVDEAMKANPDYAYPWKIQAEIFMNDEHVDKKALDKALEAYKSYSDRNSSDPSGYFERYRIFARKAQFERAAEELDRVFAIYPKYPGAHFHKGALFTLMANHKAAIAEYQAEVQNNPLNLDARIALGKAFLSVGEPKEALDHLVQAMQISPQNPAAKLEAANANRLLRNFNGAIALYRAAAAIDPGNPTIYRKMGDCLREMGDAQGARAAFKKYLEMEPDASDRNEIEPYL